MHFASRAGQLSPVLRNYNCANFCHLSRSEASSIKLIQKFCLTNNANFQISLLHIVQMFLSRFRSWKSGKKGRGRSFVPGASHTFCRIRGGLDSQLPLPGQAQTSGQGDWRPGRESANTWSAHPSENVWVYVPSDASPKPQSSSFSLIKTTSSSL